VPDSNEPLTSEMVRRYIADHGALCPFCRSPEIEGGRLDAEADCAWAPVSCAACGRRWQDVFHLGALGLVGADGSITTVGPAGDGGDGSGVRDPADPA
jgi:hypothetical protein